MKWKRFANLYVVPDTGIRVGHAEELWSAMLHPAIKAKSRKFGYTLILYRRDKPPAIVAEWFESMEPTHVNRGLESEFYHWDEVLQDAQSEIQFLWNEV